MFQKLRKDINNTKAWFDKTDMYLFYWSECKFVQTLGNAI